MNLGVTKFGVLLGAFACLVLGGVSLAGPTTDTDGDGVADFQDNCTTVSNTTQADPDNDGYGVRCDEDTDNNGGVGVSDLNAMVNEQGNSTTGSNINFDLDENGGIGTSDLNQTLNEFLGDGLPGPSSCVPTLCV